MTDNKGVIWTPETDIMKPYLNLEPLYEIICKERSNQKIVKVKLKDNIEFVIKHVRIKSTNKPEIDRLIREYSIGKILGELTDGIAMSKDIKKKNVGEYTIIEILMEYGGIPLSKFVEKGKLEKGDTMNITCQLLSILTLMEKLGIFHLDIKLSNIVWDKNKNRVKLIDFGLSLMSLGKDNIALKEVDSKKILGHTKTYSAPEIKNKVRRVTPQKLDVYSFGVTFLRLLAAEYKVQNPIKYGRDSFIEKFNIEELKEKVEKEDMDGLWEVIYKTIKGTPEHRPTFREVREVFLEQTKGMTEDDYLLDVIDNLNDHSIKIELTKNLKLRNMYQRLIYLYIQMENYDMAIKCTKKYLKIYSELRGESSSDVAYSYYILANLYFIINKEEEVITCLEKALTILLKVPRSNNQLLKMVYNTMGHFYSCSGDYKKAKEQYDEAFKIEPEGYNTEVDLGFSIAEIYACLNNYDRIKEVRGKIWEKIKKEESVQGIFTENLYIILGLTHLSIGDYEEAKKALNEALSRILSNYGEQNLLLITVHSLLGFSYGSIGNLDQAIKEFDNSLSISLETHGEMHMSTISLYLYKALAYRGKEDYNQSIELCNKSLNISLKKFGSQHQLTMRIYLCLGTLYSEISDFIEADMYFSKALDIAGKLFKGENTSHTSHVAIYDTLGILFLFHKNNADKSIHYWEKALNIASKIYDKNDQSLSRIYSRLTCAYYFKSDFQNIIELSKIGLKALLNIGKKESILSGMFYFHLGTSYFVTGNKEWGISYTTKALKAFLKICGKNHMHTITAYSHLGWMYQIKGDSANASKMTKKVLEIYKSITIEGGINAFSSYLLSGNVYSLKGDQEYKENKGNKKNYLNAKTAYKQALEISLNVFGELHYMTATCFGYLGLAYVRLEDFEEAEKCLNKALNIQMKTSAGSHYLTGIVYLYLGIIYKSTDRYEEALCALDEAFNILNLYPINHKHLVPNLNNEIQELCEIIERENNYDGYGEELDVKAVDEDMIYGEAVDGDGKLIKLQRVMLEDGNKKAFMDEEGNIYDLNGKYILIIKYIAHLDTGEVEEENEGIFNQNHPKAKGNKRSNSP